MSGILSLPETVRLGFAFFLVLLLPAAFLALCAPAVRQPPLPVRQTTLLTCLMVGLPPVLVVWLALRYSPAVLAGCLIAAAVLLLLPIILSGIARQRTGRSLPGLPPAVRLAVALFVPLFFLFAGLVADLLHVHFPHIYAIP